MRTLICCFWMALWAAGPAVAEDGTWAFVHAPGQGGALGASYAYVEAGANSFVALEYGEIGTLAALATLGTFDNGGAVQWGLEAGGAVTLRVFHPDNRYAREIEPGLYHWEPVPDAEAVWLYFQLTAADVAAMETGTAVFVQVQDQQFRFGLDHAGQAMTQLMAILRP